MSDTTTLPKEIEEPFAYATAGTIPRHKDALRSAISRALSERCGRVCCTQTTKCARCGAEKHTPWRASDGYVCVACLGAADASLEEGRRAREALRGLDDAIGAGFSDAGDVLLDPAAYHAQLSKAREAARAVLAESDGGGK